MRPGNLFKTVPRRKRKFKRDIIPDPKYDSTLVARFINQVMRRGKKSVAQRVVYAAFDLIAEKTKKDPTEIFEVALKNVSPVMEVKSKRIGGANYQIPIEVRVGRKTTLAMRWIITAARTQRGKAMREKLADELIAAAQKQGVAIKKRNDIQRMAEANRAFAHFA